MGRWKFRLFASDKEGEKVSDILEIVVRQYSRSRLVNHQFNIEFSFTDWDPQATRHWEWMVRYLKSFYTFGAFLRYQREETSKVLI